MYYVSSMDLIVTWSVQSRRAPSTKMGIYVLEAKLHRGKFKKSEHIKAGCLKPPLSSSPLSTSLDANPCYTLVFGMYISLFPLLVLCCTRKIFTKVRATCVHELYCLREKIQTHRLAKSLIDSLRLSFWWIYARPISSTSDYTDASNSYKKLRTA